jgi:hypothetical protein
MTVPPPAEAAHNMPATHLWQRRDILSLDA